MFGHLALGNCHIIFHWHCVSVFVGTLQQNVCHITNITVVLLLTVSIWTLQQHTCHIINVSVTFCFTDSTCFLHCFVWLKQSVYIWLFESFAAQWNWDYTERCRVIMFVSLSSFQSELLKKSPFFPFIIASLFLADWLQTAHANSIEARHKAANTHRIIQQWK